MVNWDFYQQYLSLLDLHQIDQLLKIECTDGQTLPYLGYIKTDVTITEITKSTHKEESNVESRYFPVTLLPCRLLTLISA